MTDNESATKELEPSSEILERKAQLKDITARAAAKDAIKDYSAASDLYSQATELQAEINGELSLENADLLFAYGKSLYNVAVSKSDVLGGKISGDPQAHAGDGSTQSTNVKKDNLIKTAMHNGANKSIAGESAGAQAESTSSKPFFQFTGDENFDDEDDEDDEQDEEPGEEDDDFANAFEVLDLARVLYSRRLIQMEEEGGKNKSHEASSEEKHVMERIADSYDLQAEISLEAERFMDAVTDLRSALKLRISLCPTEDPSVAECHYKLSLALEFASANKPEDSDNTEKATTVNQKMREEAVTHMEKAIESCRLRMAQEQKKIDENGDKDGAQVVVSKRSVANIKEIVNDMELRLVDLKRSPESFQALDQSKEDVMKGILGQVVGKASAEQTASLNAAMAGANDLSSLVRRKPVAKQITEERAYGTKRPADEGTATGDPKKTRLDGSPTSL
ncbi:hypothetical protein ASPZODRAFT_103831 [Penicilliopsis zonata CBS 506.65]|uniref:Tetratricopeptide SHNi-TPR domain-containing protein n=1 Tax=Penicilliopsis zonata CBS 506.65 TaxID=1073090 RepID=A0A1L9S819_9EURO|nr:hypothetical protein ASPZODRAFT_103831 [Penicilliopsis zonata CBS 506.65]OJJ43318.1 hypothetical protein ASPZODRAFT_103831 [Penicilliopsis zonata CBS 506.65]